MSATLREPTLQLRPMRAADIGSVVAIERRGYPFPWTEAIFHDCLRVGYCCWVLELQRGVVGYGVMSVAVGEAHLLNICIDPRHQGRGLGRRLMRRMLRLAREHGADTVFLEVRPSNRAAIALYLDLGFNEVGLRRGYYPDTNGREDAVVMAMALGPVTEL